MTKKRRYVLCAGVLAACVCLAIAVLAMLPAGPGVSKGNFDRIELGMDVSEVEQLLGGPCAPFHGFVGRETFIWTGPDGSFALVHVDAKTVIDKSWHPSNESLADKIRRWLHLPK
jgi:hypothetical protein